MVTYIVNNKKYDSIQNARKAIVLGKTRSTSGIPIYSVVGFKRTAFNRITEDVQIVAKMQYIKGLNAWCYVAKSDPKTAKLVDKNGNLSEGIKIRSSAARKKSGKAADIIIDGISNLFQ